MKEIIDCSLAKKKKNFLFILFYFIYLFIFFFEDFVDFVHDCKILVIIKLLIFRFCFVFRDPNCSDSPVTWPKFSKVNRSYLALAVKPKGKQKCRAKELKFWNSLIPKVIRQTKG